jgi:hypothetical protein
MGQDLQGRVTGKTKGVGKDIIEFLVRVAVAENLNIVVTSGFRDAKTQAKAMFDNWEKLERGRVYASHVLPPPDRQESDLLYSRAKSAKSDLDSQRAKQKFLSLAERVVGTKSAHSQGRAVDILRSSLNASAVSRILSRMEERPEGRRTDIRHFQSRGPVSVSSSLPVREHPNTTPQGFDHQKVRDTMDEEVALLVDRAANATASVVKWDEGCLDH